MKHLFTLAAAALFAVVSTSTAAHAQQPAASAPKAATAPAAAPKPAAKATASATAKPKAKAAATKYTADQIKDVQTALQKQKLYTGKINGVWGASTVKAYKAWQKANSLPETGVLTDEAVAKLKS